MVVNITPRRDGKSTRAYYATDEPSVDRRCGGKALAYLGLEADRLTERQFNALVDNRNPETGQKITVRDAAKPVVLTDITVNLPKSLTLARQFGPNGVQLIEAVYAAIERVMDQVVEPMAATRVRVSGKDEDRATGNLAWDAHFHEFSRPVDGKEQPHDHVHVGIFRFTRDPIEGRHKALKTKAIHDNMPAIQQAFLDEIRQAVTAIGYRTVTKRIGRDKKTGKELTSFELAGVGKSTIQKFSERRGVIKGWLEKTSGRGKKKAAVVTREEKRKLTPEAIAEVKADWVSRLTRREVNLFKSLQAKPKVGRGLSAAQRHVDMLRFLRHTSPAMPTKDLTYGPSR